MPELAKRLFYICYPWTGLNMSHLKIKNKNKMFGPWWSCCLTAVHKPPDVAG